MSHFYGVLQGSRGQATRCGTSFSGLTVTAAGWDGALEIELWQDSQGRDRFRVRQKSWQGSGVERVIAGGLLGKHATLKKKGREPMAVSAERMPSGLAQRLDPY
jgi:hypothetical protein